MKYNRDGSPDRQQARHQNLMRCVKQLQQRGYGKRWDASKLGKREVSLWVDDWRTQGLSHRTITNRMVDIRWLATKVGRLDNIPSNKDIGIGLRKNAVNYGHNKAVAIDRHKLASVPERERLITELRVEFGLRTQEAIKFQHEYATKIAGYITLKGSWTKGGRPRSVAITHERQVDVLKRVAQYQQQQGDKSMIPHHRRFKSYYRDYNEVREKAGVLGHEYRHQWAQDRFKAVSGGIQAPHAGGTPYQDLTPEQQQRWDTAAQVVNQELGHGDKRADITANYIGAKTSE
ncbi:MAG: hypothetical protein COB90_10650 [Hyphomicrobiales bacterium]|nr:MAG: hypothetical protein COB90_10650 [Hyphomicrobiales bacterium]